MTDKQKTGDSGRGHFLAEGYREMGRKLVRSKTRRTIRQQEADRAVALTALGRQAWETKIDLAAFAGLRDRLAGLDTRVGEISETANKLGQEKEGLERERSTELEKFAAGRKAVETKKSPVDAALREARSRKSACEQAIRQGESRLAAIAGRLAVLDRDIASPGAGAAADAQQKLATLQSERATLAAEQNELGAKLAASRAELPAHATQESSLAAESQKHAAEIAAIDAEQKAAIAHIDTNLRRVQSETQGASQQASAVQKDRAGTFLDLGTALYDSAVRDPALVEAIEGVASIDRSRAQAESALDSSLAETRSLAGGTMGKFWSVLIGVPLLLAALGAGTYQFLHRRAAPAPVALPTPAAPGQGCTYQAAPAQGEGVAVSSDCTRTEGTFVEGRLHGKGSKVWPSGERMEGQFYSGYLYGPGVRVYRDGRRVEATFSGGRAMGPGKITMPDGTVYQGRLWGPIVLGWGVRRSPDGEVLAGDWREAPDNGMRPIGLMLRVRPGGAREKVEAASLDPASAKPAAPASQGQPASDDKLY
ncbi:MAG: hypothetical protein IPP91_15955 [Betaproteobacteria bacterium]|nr:hypothetical protein [Betaproteobacteria bacterium]